MPVSKIAVRLSSFRLPFRRALEAAARIGAAGVEIDGRRDVRPEELTGTGLRHVRKMLDDFNLRVSAVRFPTRRGYDVDADLDRRVEATRNALKMAYELGTNVVVNRLGRVPAEPSGVEWDRMIGTLSELGRFGQHVGAFLAAETGPEPPEALLRLIGALPEGSIGVNLDPGGLEIHGYSSSEAAESLGRHVLHVVARDGVRDASAGAGMEVPLGRGSVDFPLLVGLLEEHEYRGWFSAVRERSDDAPFELGQALKYLRSL